jgi:hypothetical protein
MNNQQYVQTLEVDEQAQQTCLKAMEKYGDNHWWESSDLRKIAYYQINEPISLLKDFSRFHEGVELLLGHGVPNIVLGNPRVKAEVEAAWQELHR